MRESAHRMLPLHLAVNYKLYDLVIALTMALAIT